MSSELIQTYERIQNEIINTCPDLKDFLEINISRLIKLEQQEIYEEQKRILFSCGYNDLDNDSIIMSHKYFMELLVRPAFGDDDTKYEELSDLFDRMKLNFKV